MKVYDKNSDANRLAEAMGRRGNGTDSPAEEFKKEYTSFPSKFNLGVEESDGQVYLVPVNRGSIPNAPTGEKVPSWFVL